MSFDNITIETIDNGFIVHVNSFFSHTNVYAPTLAGALEEVVYRVLRIEGSDVPNQSEDSEVLNSLRVFYKTFIYKAVEKALKDNAEDLKQFEEKNKEEEIVAPSN